MTYKEKSSLVIVAAVVIQIIVNLWLSYTIMDLSLSYQYSAYENARTRALTTIIFCMTPLLLIAIHYLIFRNYKETFKLLLIAGIIAWFMAPFAGIQGRSLFGPNCAQINGISVC